MKRRLDNELAAHRPLLRDVDRTDKIDMRTKEGKRRKAHLCAEAVRLREEGYPFGVIGEAIGIDPATVAMWVTLGGSAQLAYAPTKHRDRPDVRRGVRDKREDAERARRVEAAEERRQNMDRARAEYDAAKREGRAPAWHAAPRVPDLPQQQQAELANLVARQTRELDRAYFGWGERPTKSPSAGGTASLDEHMTLRRNSDAAGGKTADPLGEFVLGVVPSAEDEVLEEEFRERLQAELGELTLDRIQRLDENSLARLRDKLRQAGLVHLSVQAKERERLRTPAAHRGEAPARLKSRVGVGSKHKRRQKVAADRHSRPSRKPRKQWQTREKAVYDWKAAA